MQLWLRWPPSGNNLRIPVRVGRGLRLIDAPEYRTWKDETALDLLVQRPGKRVTITGRIALEIEMRAPDLRRRDISNIIKASEDAIVRAGVIADDSQIDDLHVTRGPLEKDGILLLTIREL